uniref:C-type lectin domain-containing protein n=1 Tax=Plectus sambesii TaxID=2011161 RepID=A0A914VIE8_9BILA
MLFSLAILLFISPTVTALTDLQAQCNGTDRLYNDTSCYVVVGPKIYHYLAKISCNHYLGYSGHIVHMRDAATQAAVLQAVTTYTGYGSYWLGLETINSSTSTTVSTNYGNYYRNGTVVIPTYFPWGPNQPVNGASYKKGSYNKSTNAIYNIPATEQSSNICEYEEALKQPVTDLERKCVNLTSSFRTLFVNDVCYVAHFTFKNYNDAKVACNALSGYNGHLAHVRTMSELWAADAVLKGASVTCGRLGIEQTNLSSTDPYNGWYLTTPTAQSIPTTFLPWAAGYPQAGGGYRTIAVQSGSYPKSFGTVNDTTPCPYLCQYDGPGPSTTTTTSTSATATTTTTTTPTTTTTATTPVTTITAAGACTRATTTSAGGTGSTAATTNAGRTASSFSHYRFGYFKNTCYWLDQLTVTFSKCLNMCHENELCFGLSYNSGTNDCQLLAIIASASPYWFELTADKQYETVIRELQ